VTLYWRHDIYRNGIQYNNTRHYSKNMFRWWSKFSQQVKSSKDQLSGECRSADCPSTECRGATWRDILSIFRICKSFWMMECTKDWTKGQPLTIPEIRDNEVTDLSLPWLKNNNGSSNSRLVILSGSSLSDGGIHLCMNYLVLNETKQNE